MSFRIRDGKSKKALIRYIRQNPKQRLFQCITNFTKEELGEDINNISAAIYYSINESGEVKAKYIDTFFWECDEKLK